ncbi:MAG: molybdopterin-dependent oxidoreductase [Burkholderiales bacterium]|nr:molybdopterin-dependent oxidoreductase [Burkholderiales bacterium]
MSRQVIPSTCSECSVRCGALVHVEDGKVVRITGNPAHPGSRGAFCVKGMNAPLAALDHPARITRPMRRLGARGEGRWAPVSWEHALDEIADRLGEIKGTHGGPSIAGAVSNHEQSRAIAVRLLLRSLGSPNFMINQDLCHGCRYTASMLTGAGGLPGSELAKARVILVVGESPSDSHVVEWMHMKAAKANGARLIVVDPRRSQSARLADHWLRVKPGTDAALALSMIHVLFGENLFDREFVEQWCTGAGELRERCTRYPPAVAAKITGVAAESIVEAARLFATTRPGSMLIGHGVDAQANGVATIMAFQALLAITANLDREGTNRPRKQLRGWRGNFREDPRFRLPREIETKILGGETYPLWAGPESSLNSCHNPAVLRAIHTGEPYPVRAMYVANNIVCTYPDIHDTVAALKKLDLLVVLSDQMTPTAELADFFLPRTTLLEEEDVFLDQNGPCVSITQRIVQPRGEARTGMQIAIDLAAVLRERGVLDHDFIPWKSEREFNEYLLAETAVDWRELRARGFCEMPFGYESYRARGFRTPSGKIELAPGRLRALGLDPLPDYRQPVYARPGAREYDLTLLTGIRSMAYHHSRFREFAWARRIQDAPELRIHPATAARLGIDRHDWAWVEMQPGMPRVLLKAFVTDEIPEDIVATGMGWWYPEMEGPDHGAATFNVDVAVPYGPEYDPVTGSAEARVMACKVMRADPEDVKMRLPRAARAPAGIEDLVATG